MALRILYRHPQKYKESLDAFIKEANSKEDDHRQLCSFYQYDELKQNAFVLSSQSSSRKDLVYQNTSQLSTDTEEVVATLQGYVLRCNLPPITRLDQIPKNPVTAKQSIVITGLGSMEFERSARAVLQIHTMFESTLPEGTLIPWKPTRDCGYMCLEFSNRYFRSKDDGEYATMPLGQDIDPQDLLGSRCRGAEHTEDNVVLYYERKVNSETGNKNYTPCEPVMIRVGQLVEVQASFCAVPVSKGRHIMLSKLRAICILSTQVQEDLNDEVFNFKRSAPSSPTKKTKRNVGYYTQDDEAMEERAREDMKRMRIDGEDAQ